MSSNVTAYRTGNCIAAKRVLKKYKKYYKISNDNTINMVWLSYLAFLESFAKDLREYSVNNQIKKFTAQQVLKLYEDTSSKYNG